MIENAASWSAVSTEPTNGASSAPSDAAATGSTVNVASNDSSGHLILPRLHLDSVDGTVPK